MAWTLPRTWVTGELVTASIGNLHWRDNLLALGTPFSQAVSNAALTLTNAGDYQVWISGSLNVGDPAVSKTVTANVSSGAVSGTQSLSCAIGVSNAHGQYANQFKVTGVSAGATISWSGDTAALSGGTIVARQLLS